MGKLKDRGGYDKILKGRKGMLAKHGNIKPETETNVTKESIYPSKKVHFNLEPIGPTHTPYSNHQEDDRERIKNKSIINTVKFKAPKKHENKSTFLKLKQKQSKYTEIKQDIIKQINTSDVIAEPGVLTSDNHLNFVTHSKTKLTNTLLKKILNQPKTQNITPNLKTPADKCKSKHLTDFIGNKTINKKAKMGIKKNLWAQKISLIKGQLKNTAAKERREKAVITGDMQPMLNSLIDTKPELFPKQEELNDGLSDIVTLISKKEKKVRNEPLDKKALSKKERREKNLENEQAKAIKKNSIRFKNSQNDIALFGQLLDFKEFTSNPLETLKKHMNS